MSPISRARWLMVLVAASAWGCTLLDDESPEQVPCPPSSPPAAAGAGGLAQGGTSASAGSGSGAAPTAGQGGAPLVGVPDTTPCAMVPVADCGAATHCQVLIGQRVSVELGCLSAAEAVGCGTKDGCVAEPTRATDASGQDWVFPSSCLPATFADSTSMGTRFDECGSTP